MEACIYFKKKREKTKITIRNYAALAGISASFLCSLQNGEYDFKNITLGNVISLFELANINIFEFYEEFYPELKEEVNNCISEWYNNNPKELNLEKLRIRFYNRIQQIKGRNRIAEEDVVILQKEHNRLFIFLRDYVDRNGNISEADYDYYILPFSYLIRKKMEEGVPEDEKLMDPLVNAINDAIIKSDFSYADLGNIIGVSNRRLSMLKKFPEGYKKMKIGSFLKMCYALKITDIPVVEKKHYEKL